MAKPILGDDPFDPGAKQKPAAKAKAQPAPKKKPARAKAPAAPKKKKAAPVEQEPETPPEIEAEAAPEIEAEAAPEIEAEAAPEIEAEVAETPEPEPAVEAAPEPEPEIQAAPATSIAVTRAPASIPSPAPVAMPPLPAEVGSEYGPSIDRPRSGGFRGRAVEQLRAVEDRVRGLLSPEGEGDRRSPPLPSLWKPLRALAMRTRADHVDDFGRDPHTTAAADPFLDFLYRTWFRASVEGVGNVPAEGRAVIVANHAGALPWDAMMLMHAIQREHAAHREVRPLVEDFVFHFPYLGPLLNRVGAVRACQENAERLLAGDQVVAVFPEGQKGSGKLFRQRYQLQRFGRGGFIKLALGADAPIIPAAIVGAEETFPMLGKVTMLTKAIGAPYVPLTPTFPWLGPAGLLPLPSKWFIAFGEPLYWNAEYGAAGAEDRILVNKLAEQVRQRIQEMLDGLLARRRSVLFG